MATFVLVHPAWFGGWCWWKAAPLLRARGHTVYAPTLTGLGERVHLANPSVGLHTHISDVANVIEFEGLAGVVLVGHSSSGMVITGVADRMPDRVAHVVYLDAFVPADGQSLVDIIPPERQAARNALAETEGGGWSIPRFAPASWDEFVPAEWKVTDEADLQWILPRLRPCPVGHFAEPVKLFTESDRQPPRTYIRCRRWPNPLFDRYAAEAGTRPGWESFDLDADHLPFVTHPRPLADLLARIAA